MKTILRFPPSAPLILSVAVGVSGCGSAPPETQFDEKSPFTPTFTVTYQQTDEVRAEANRTERIKRRYIMTLSSDGVRSFQQLDPVDDPPAKRKTLIFDGRNQVELLGAPQSANEPREAFIQARYRSLTNPVRPALEYGGTPVTELLNTIKAKRVGVEHSPEFGDLEVYDADFGNNIAIHFTGRFRVTTGPRRLIVDSVESSEFGTQAFRNEFHCKKLRTVGNIALPEVAEVTTYQSPYMATPMGSAHFVLTALSDRPLPDADFHIKLPPGSRLTDATNGNAWRIEPGGRTSFLKKAAKTPP